MNRRKMLMKAAGVFVFALCPVLKTNAETFHLRADSTMIGFDGTSTLHDFSGHAAEMDGVLRIVISQDTMNFAISDSAAACSVTVPVKGLTTGEKGMNKNMYTTLKAEAHPLIRYVLNSDSVVAVEKPSTVSLATRGDLTIAGVTREVVIPVTVRRKGMEAGRIEGSLKIKLTDFGITPPTFFLGMLKVGNIVKVHFSAYFSERL